MHYARSAHGWTCVTLAVAAGALLVWFRRPCWHSGSCSEIRRRPVRTLFLGSHAKCRDHFATHYTRTGVAAPLDLHQQHHLLTPADTAFHHPPPTRTCLSSYTPRTGHEHRQPSAGLANMLPRAAIRTTDTPRPHRACCSAHTTHELTLC